MLNDGIAELILDKATQRLRDLYEVMQQDGHRDVAEELHDILRLLRLIEVRKGHVRRTTK